MGGDIKVVYEDGSNGVGPWDYVQGSVTNSAASRYQKKGGDGVDVDTNHGYDSGPCGAREVGIPPVGGGPISSGLIPHTGVHPKTVCNNGGTGGIPTHI